MRDLKFIKKATLFIILVSTSIVTFANRSDVYADPYTYNLENQFHDQPKLFKNTVHLEAEDSSSEDHDNDSIVKEREVKEKKIPPNFFAITLYRPTYVLPYYFTRSPYKSLYQNSTPYDQGLKSSESKFQLSFKIPVWQPTYRTTLYLAYTQLSYWQVYNRYPFFRETDYEPELFLAKEVNCALGTYWHFNLLNVGISHQSNGYGGPLERTWNRIYVDAIGSTENWMVSLKPWLILHDSNFKRYNPNLPEFLGYGRLLVAYKYNGHVLSLEAHNFLEDHARSITGQLTWSFPLTNYLKGYIQLFSGYGQSLIEYNHRTNSAGIGIALNDWI